MLNVLDDKICNALLYMYVRRQLRSANSRTSNGPTAATETDVSLLQVLSCETTFQLI